MPVPRARLVGRARELGELRTALDAVRAGGNRTLVIAGEAGIVQAVGREAVVAAAGPAAAPASSGSGPDALTPREQQVLALVAEGLTNGQIAERLFISAKTASVQVSAILRKLGVASRTEAALRASR
ncbi:helix-turn-helix transcriptional regulator [Promicromonospora iranensis]|uniref:DNA-binding NarL/FixJ family response regulator n=1 Tax=Promicromonospora iranensis TaxID=1105144 RepID=A0ABU2CTE0_9MICO|nr:LuxR C-terminal-related transcriptional regulator [Promicromonospora iranensis]MDR7384607.1 DNA-binding NarL/FixJ family response regulator [Promicromonospora iranensis]